MRKSAESMPKTYGQLIGELIFQRRTAARMTQLELALEAFEDETKVRRIVEIERGQVARPHSGTIGPLCETLNITPEEIKWCRTGELLAEAKEDKSAAAISEDLLIALAQKYTPGFEADLQSAYLSLKQALAEAAALKARAAFTPPRPPL